jgi:hypothetical protein
MVGAECGARQRVHPSLTERIPRTTACVHCVCGASRMLGVIRHADNGPLDNGVVGAGLRAEARGKAEAGAACMAPQTLAADQAEPGLNQQPGVAAPGAIGAGVRVAGKSYSAACQHGATGQGDGRARPVQPASARAPPAGAPRAAAGSGAATSAPDFTYQQKMLPGAGE